MDEGDNFQGTVLGNCLPFLYTLCMLKFGITPRGRGGLFNQTGLFQHLDETGDVC